MPLPLITTSSPSEAIHIAPPPTFCVLGIPVHAVQIPEVVSRIQGWIRAGNRGRYIAVTSMHGIAESRTDVDFRCALDCADLVVPDGMPLVWLGRRNGHALKRRVYGPELMETFCRETGSTYRHFF